MMVRELAKTGFATGIHWLGLDKLIGSRMGLEKLPLIVSYHRVVENFAKSARRSIAPMLVSKKTFERHLDWIGQRYDLVSLDELVLRLEKKGTCGKPVAAITFDDGYSDVYHNAFPILKRKGIPAAVFVVTDLIGTSRLQVHDEIHLLASLAASQWRTPKKQMRDLVCRLDLPPLLARKLCRYPEDSFRITRTCLEALPQSKIDEVIRGFHESVDITSENLQEFRAMSWEALQEMAAHGVTVGSHTRSHALLANESWWTVLDEIRGSREELEKRLGKKVRHFAYPDGRFNENAVKGVAEAGFSYAYTTCMHRDRDKPLLTIPRRVFWEKSCLDSFGRFSPAILSCQVNGIFDPALRCRQEHWA